MLDVLAASCARRLGERMPGVSPPLTNGRLLTDAKYRQ
jgi:hypothetical protein